MQRVLLALCLLSTVAGGGQEAAAASASPGAGSWSEAASLATGREEHTATLLASGKVLIAGGTDGRGSALAIAVLYDPRSNRWTSAGPMSTSRLGHSATLMADGKVLVAGGVKATFPSNTLASAELYDPAKNSWSEAAPMTSSRSRHTATLLADGRVLVVGGLNVQLLGGGLFVGKPSDAEVYDPLANRWSPTAPMAQYRRDQAAVRLLDGRVLVSGSQDNLTYNTVEIYQPERDKWHLAAPMTSGRSGHSAVLLANGDVLVAGGVSQGDNAAPIELTSAEIYHPATDRWSRAASMAQVHPLETATQLDDGRVLVLGGTSRSRAELYDPVSDRWSPTGPSVARYQHTATLLRDGKVLVVGGLGVELLRSVQLYDPSGIAPSTPQPINTAVLLVGLVLLVATAAWSLSAVRRRIRILRPGPGAEEWINP